MTTIDYEKEYYCTCAHDETQNTLQYYYFISLYSFIHTFIVQNIQENAMHGSTNFPSFHPPTSSLKTYFCRFSLLPFLLSFHSICSAKRKGAFLLLLLIFSCFSFAHFSCLLCVQFVWLWWYAISLSLSSFLNTLFCSIFILLLLFFPLSFWWCVYVCKRFSIFSSLVDLSIFFAFTYFFPCFLIRTVKSRASIYLL